MTLSPNSASAGSGQCVAFDQDTHHIILLWAIMLRKCSGCGLTVPRRHCHKNRYGEYLCRTCQASGLKFTKAARWRSWIGQTPAIVLWSLIGTALLALVAWALYALTVGLVSVDFPWTTDRG